MVVNREVSSTEYCVGFGSGASLQARKPSSATHKKWGKMRKSTASWCQLVYLPHPNFPIISQKLVFERDFVDFISILSLFFREINKQRGSDSWWLPHILYYIHLYLICWSVKCRLRTNLQTRQKKSGHMLLCFHKVGWDREIKCW